MRSLLAGILALILAASLILTASPLLATSPLMAADHQGPARVIDGDTIEVGGLKIRLHGIDAPERRQLCIRDSQEWFCGEAATDALTAFVQTRPVVCEGMGLDRYGRLVARCRVSGEDIGEWMVRQGWALAYRRYSTDYAAAEEEAKAAGVGIWGTEFMAPWEWRKIVRHAE